MQIVTLEQYFAGHPALMNPDIGAVATAMLAHVNDALLEAIEDGIPVHINPSTGCRIGGSGNGGIRPIGSLVGAAHSKHQSGHAVDIYDPKRELAQWCWGSREHLRSRLGLCFENFRWTPTWVHFQDVPPGSGHTIFIPNTSPPLAPLLDGQDA